MNVLFLSLIGYSSIKIRDIYTDLLREFINHGYKVYIVSPAERRQGIETGLIKEENSTILRVKTGNIQKTNLIEKGISTIMLEPQFVAAIKKYFGSVKFDLILYCTPPITIAKAVEYVKRRDGATTYLMLKDIFPQNAVDMGIMTKSGLRGLLYKIFRAKEKKMYSLTNIPSLPIGTYERNKKESGSARIIFLSRIHPKKNLLAALQFLENSNGNIKFDIYGPIEDTDYWEECQKEIKKLGKAVEVNYKGLINHDDVHKTFSQYDAFIFPTLSENYGHVIIESLIVGTPVIISDGTPWTDVNYHNAGWAYNLCEKEQFIKAINQLIQFDNKDMEEISNNAKRYAETKLKIQNLRMEYSKALESMFSL